ncbi:MAG: right-handed parallel beta-helix repeat-containing protein, partial [Chloroflexi bacterium]
KGVWLAPLSRAILRNCNIEYGGAAAEPALKIQSPKSAIIVNSAVRHAAGDGVYVDSATPPVLNQNEVSGNVFGVRNNRTAVPVDARQVWWGDTTGPYHATLNPGGLGNAVSDGVLFDPWLTEPPTPATTAGGLSVLLSGPRVASPGSRVTYGILFANQTEETVSGAVLVADLARDGRFAGASPGAKYWAKRRHVFWQPGDLAPGGAQAFYLSVDFAWNIPLGTWESTLGGVTGVPGASSVFTAADYLNYSPEQPTGTQVLTAAELAGELAASPGLNQLYQNALAQEYLHGAAFRVGYVGVPPLVRIILLDFPNRRVMILQQQGTRLLATVAEPQAVVLSDTEGGDRYDLITGQHGFFGGWASSLTGLNAAYAPAGDPTFANCMLNCIRDEVPEWLVGYASAGASRALAAKDCWEAQATLEEGDLASCGASIQDEIPVAGELIDIAKCTDDCKNDPTSNYCVEDKITCGCTGPTVLGLCWGQDAEETWECDQETGLLGWTPKWTTGCPINVDAPTRCVEGQGCVLIETAGPKDISLLQILLGKDPNAKYGPEGDLVPGQLVTYTITYENEGAGEAYGVFVVDELSEGFDLATLTLHGDADFVERT